MKIAVLLIIVGLFGCTKLESAQDTWGGECSERKIETDYALKGSGTPADPYVICTSTQLRAVSQTSAAWSKSFRVAQDIDLSGVAMSPIGIHDSVTPANSVPFTGHFDGGNFAIKNLKLTAVTNQSTGLFGYTKSAALSNFKLVSVDISGGGDVGGLVGYNDGTPITNVTVGGAITASAGNAGGVVGSNHVTSASDDATITNARCSAALSLLDAAGGIVGYHSVANGKADIVSSSFTGSISQSAAGGNSFGGLVGLIDASAGARARISDSYSIGTLTMTTGGSFSGGFVGTLSAADSDISISRSFVNGTVQLPSAFFVNPNRSGGFAGLINCGTNSTCAFDRISFTGTYRVPNSAQNPGSIGGLIGDFIASSPATLSNSFVNATFDVLNPNADGIGGIFGTASTGASGTIIVSNSYSATRLLQPLSGTNKGSVFGSYGGAVGFTNVFADSTLWSTVGPSSPVGVTTLTTTQMYQQANYTGWNFVSVWTINEGAAYPQN